MIISNILLFTEKKALNGTFSYIILYHFMIHKKVPKFEKFEKKSKNKSQ